MLEFGIDTT